MGYHRVAPSVYRYESSGTYFAIFRVQGKLKKKKLKSRSLREAKMEAARLKEKTAGLVPGAGRYTLAALADRHLATTAHLSASTRLRNAGIVAKLKEWPGASRPADSLTRSELLGWLNESTAGLSTDSRNKHLLLLRAIFDLAVRDRLLAESPLRDEKISKPPDPERLIPSEQEVRAIIENIRDQCYNADAADSANFVELLLLSGLGNSEAAALRWRDVDWDGNRISAYRNKTDTGFHIPLYPRLRAFLESLPRGEPDDRVLAVRNVRKALGNACKRLGLPNYTHRAIRRCFIRGAVERGIDFQTIASWQGHRDGGKLIAQVYSFLRDDHSQEMAKRLA